MAGIGGERVVVVGGGVGGLACAIDLAARGFQVSILERAPDVGGKMRTAAVGDARIDAGPTVLTMRWVFDELFDSAGASFDDRVSLERAEVLARHTWSDGSTLDLFADRDRSAAAIGELFGADEAKAYRAFLNDGERIFRAVEQPFLRSERPTFASILQHGGLGGLGALTTIDAFRSMWTALSRRFRHPKLRQLFGRYATYCGSSPFDAPATLNLVAYVEAAGVDRVRGGIAALRGALADLARSVGVEIRTGCDVVQVLVRGGRATGVVIGGGEVQEATAVVWNGDVSSLARALRGPEAHRAPARTSIEKRSLSAITWALVAKADGPLIHHNVFFSDDYPAEFESIEQDRLTPEAPTVYLCAQDRADADEDRDEDRILLVVNAPASGDEPPCWTEPEVERCERNAIRTLTRCGLTLAATAKEVSTPLDFERRYPGTGGALYGPIARGPFSALSRQGAASKIAGLYLAGGSVHPGPGLPMAALSGRLAARRVRQDLER